jgi:hypothetical protein
LSQGAFHSQSWLAPSIRGFSPFSPLVGAALTDLDE